MNSKKITFLILWLGALAIMAWFHLTVFDVLFVANQKGLMHLYAAVAGLKFVRVFLHGCKILAEPDKRLR